MKASATFLTALVVCLAQNVAAQDSIPVAERSNKLEIVRMTPEVVGILKKTRPVENRSIPVPKFAVKSANNNFILTIGGSITPVFGYDIGNNLYKQSDAT